jgi:hydrogenase-4 component B
MSAEVLVLLGICLHLTAGVVAGVAPGRRRSDVALVLALLASLALGAAAGLGLVQTHRGMLVLPWPVPGAAIVIVVDALSAVFLFPVALLGAAAAVSAHQPWEGEAGGRWNRVAMGLLLAGIAAVLTARQGLWFLLCWEAMAISAWAALSAEHRRREVRVAGWIYLIFTRLATGCLIAMSLLLALRLGSPNWLGAATPPHRFDPLILSLALVGFGAKAGLLPLHAWLPAAHANAPARISALMSGLLIATGFYGLIRIGGLIGPPPAWWGLVLVVVGAASAVYGIASAVAQSDCKRLLAYSSIENLGLCTLGLGLSVVALNEGATDLALLAACAALLHVVHHAAFKGLLFLGAGALLHATGTRELEAMGGLLRRMPVTGRLWMVGAAAAAGIPGFAGFASEWLLLRAGFAAAASGSWAGPVTLCTLVLCGSLAAIAYTSLIGSALLGEPRSPAAAQAHEAHPAERRAMTLLALACVLLPMLAPWTLTLVAPAALIWLGLPSETAVPALDGLLWAALAGPALVVSAAALWWWLRRRLAIGGERTALTWDCGFSAPTARMQYTSSSFSATIVDEVLPPLLRPERRLGLVEGLFPAPARLDQRAGDGILDRVLEPITSRIAAICLRLRLLQQGLLPIYLLYLLCAVVALMAAALLGAGEAA